MEQCDYQAVNTDTKCDGDVVQWKYFLRQVFLASTIFTQYFTAGLCMGTPTVLVPQWRKQNNVIDDELSTWLYSACCFSAIPWVLFIPTFSAHVGRKAPYLISGCSMLFVFSTLYFSVTPYHVIISQILQGFSHACNITTTALIITEYINPRYRGLFLTIKSASYFWGIWAANAIGTFFSWRYIGIAGFICALYSVSGAFYPESPHWLASKKRFDKAKSSFRWLHGCNQRSEKELQTIIDSQLNVKRMNPTAKWNWENFVTTISCRQYYLPLGLSIIMSVQYHFSGKLVCTTYAVDMIKKMTDDEYTAYMGMLILDGVTVFGMYVGSFISKVLKRRTLYMTASFIGVLFLFILSLHLYLVKLDIIEESNVVTIVLLTIYSVFISCGPMIMSMTVIGEIIPIRYQASCYTIQATLFAIIYSLLIKFAPYIFNAFGMDGSFLFYGITSGGSLVVLYFYLPETKDKTLLEIEEYFRDKEELAQSFKESNEERTVL